MRRVHKFDKGGGSNDITPYSRAYSPLEVLQEAKENGASAVEFNGNYYNLRGGFDLSSHPILKERGKAYPTFIYDRDTTSLYPRQREYIRYNSRLPRDMESHDDHIWVPTAAQIAEQTPSLEQKFRTHMESEPTPQPSEIQKLYMQTIQSSKQPASKGQQAPVQSTQQPKQPKQDTQVTQPIQKVTQPTQGNQRQTQPKQGVISSFGSAFSSARKAGQREFTYNGKQYNTRLSGESTEEWLKSIGRLVDPIFIKDDELPTIVIKDLEAQKREMEDYKLPLPKFSNDSFEIVPQRVMPHPHRLIKRRRYRA